MNYFHIRLMPYIVFSGLLCTVKCIHELTALSDSLHTLKLYEQVGNKDPPYQTDLAASDPRIRKRICQEAFEESRYFNEKKLYSIQMTDVYEKLSHSRYALIFQRIFKNKRYWNPYELRQFKLMRTNVIEEHVFFCFLRHWSNGNLEYFHISKEYDLNMGIEPFKPGRFIFAKSVPNSQESVYHMVLAEEPVQVYEEPGFNVEMDYLEKRKHFDPANTNEEDPLCKLISDKLFDLNDQHNRLCVAVFSSSIFKNQIKHPKLHERYPCTPKKISFKTAGEIADASGKEYFERLALCHSKYLDTDLGHIYLYISRAYESNRIFVYFQDKTDGRIYLQNMSTNVSIVDYNDPVNNHPEE